MADLEKNGMQSIVEAIERMKWTKMVTVSEASYPDLVKAFYTCLKIEEDGSLSSTVKGTPIHITYDLLERLFGVSIIGRSGVDSVDIHAKGLGFIGTEYKLKDVKIDINQLNAFNRILHFIAYQILVPRSATFSTYPKADSDMMFWAIQNQDINMAQVIIERMKFAAEMIWDKKNKLNVSLPYAHFLTRIFNHYGIDLKGEVMEKVDQSIRSRNMKKSGCSLVGNLWTKTSVAEGEAIIGEVPEIQQVQDEEAEVRVEEPVAVARRIEEIAPELIKPVGQSSEVETTSTVIASIIEESLATVAHIEGEQEETHEEDITHIPAEDIIMEERQEAVIPEVVAPGHSEDMQMEDAPFQGGPVIQEGADIQGEPTVSAPADKFKEGLVEGTSSADVDIELAVSSGKKGKGVATKSPLLTKKAHRRSKKKKIRVHLKPVIERLNAHGEILCSVQSDISSIFISQSTGVKEIGAVKAELQGMKEESGPPGPAVKESGRPGPSMVESAPIRPLAKESGPLGPLKSRPIGPLAKESGSSGPLESEEEQVRIQEPLEEASVPPEPPVPSSLQTPAPSSPPPSFSAPPAPEPSKKLVPKHISSPTPFPTTSSYSPISSIVIPPPPTFEEPPASSSAGPSSAGPSAPSPPTSFYSLHPPTPPSFITIIPEGARIQGEVIQDIKYEFEEAILRSVLSVSSHVHRMGSSSPTPKKRKVSKNLALSSEPRFPPLWFSFSIENRRRSLYYEFLQKCTFATIFGLPHRNLTEHLTIVLPLSHISKSDQSKIFSIAESETEDQWARGHQSLYRQFVLAKSDRFPPSDHPLTLSEWFFIHHRSTRGPFIQREIKLIRHFQMFHDYQFLNKLPEIQLGQFRGAIAQLQTENPINTSLQVDFATLKLPEVVFLPKLHSLLMNSTVGTIIFERFARVMARIIVCQGAPLAFHRFIFHEYHRGNIKSEVLAPLLSECERLSPFDWEKHYNQATQQLLNLNFSLARSNKPTLSADEFLDLNSINLAQDPFAIWVERYKVYIPLKKDLKQQ
ncbi:hypothetical protein Taro_031763 [Colocasia esculenta]|uniref:Putative plant transposon protein domain-containing protein n=1 Tax=Colocasia esculenta TaxID=4460 RepID=A0A843VXH3_COLES|nr:hypothetical protein [Colocasia esculenta]